MVALNLLKPPNKYLKNKKINWNANLTDIAITPIDTICKSIKIPYHKLVCANIKLTPLIKVTANTHKNKHSFIFPINKSGTNKISSVGIALNK